MITKICTKCLLPKPVEKFPKSGRGGKNGQVWVKNKCRKCHQEEDREARKTWSKEKLAKHRERKRKERANYKQTSPERALLKRAKKRATINGLPFNIELSDIIIPKLCPIVGIPLFVSYNGGHIDNSPSIDKVNPNEGYVKGNIAIISYRANRLKSNLTLQQIKNLLSYIKKYGRV